MIALLVLLPLFIGQAIQRSAAPPEKPGTCEIRGRITDKQTGQPIAPAVIRLRRTESQEGFVARTDEAGQYRLSGLNPGEYRGFVDVGPHRATHAMEVFRGGPEGRTVVVLKDGEVRDVNIALSPTAALTVRVVDDSGDPLTGIDVRLKSVDGGRYTLHSWQQTTDDQGRLRIFRISPGSYFVCAEPNPLGFVRTSDSPRAREGLVRTCFPSALAESQAEPVQIDRSQDDEVVIRMHRGR
jgi:5-hydroxyisourate hydrolase-like protein (transthyretin family)